MIRKNLFHGDSIASLFANNIYDFVKSRKWFSNADVMAAYLGLKSAKDLEYQISKYDRIKELNKAFMDIREAIGTQNFETEGNNRNKRFRYIGKEDDPLADMRNAKTISDLKRYWQFCQDSAGFFPTAWLNHFFKNSRDLLEIKNRRKKGQQVLSASLDRMYTNIELLPTLYEAIINKQMLSINYKSFGENVVNHTFHPQYLKEFNGRWHLFGHSENQSPEFGVDLALDRICDEPKPIANATYISAPKDFYTTFFNDIIGVSHFQNAEVKKIHIRAHTFYIFKLTETKKLHHSQETIKPFGVYDDGEYGEFTITVEVNNEFIGRILQMGAGLEIVSPDDVREILKHRVEAIAKLYE